MGRCANPNAIIAYTAGSHHLLVHGFSWNIWRCGNGRWWLLRFPLPIALAGHAGQRVYVNLDHYALVGALAFSAFSRQSRRRWLGAFHYLQHWRCWRVNLLMSDQL